MHKICSIINNGYNFNFRSVELPFKKKYIAFLTKLVKLNFIVNFQILNNKVIKIFLKYYNNKPLFKFILISTNANKKYLKLFEIKKINRYNNFNLNFFSTDLGYLVIDELIYKNSGGNQILKIEFLNDKAILR